MTPKIPLIRMVSTASAFAIVAFAGLSLSAQAADTVNVLKNPEQYLVGRGPVTPYVPEPAPVLQSATADGIEKAAAVIPGNFTVIPNITPGLNDNVSFIRFPNFNPDIASTASIRMVGDATGRDYGTAQVVSQPFSSPQLTVNQLLESIEGGTFDPADTSITLYIQSNQFLTGVQHVYYNQFSDFFENMSVCSFVDGISNLPATSGVVNVHTTTLQSRFPSVVKVHNKNSVATTLTLRVHDGPTGNLRGRFSFVAQPNSTYSFSAPQLQANVGYIPTPDDFHMNVFFDTAAEAPPNATISHTVSNVRVFGAVLNLTTICTIND
jgi:hypothetical protein